MSEIIATSFKEKENIQIYIPISDLALFSFTLEKPRRDGIEPNSIQYYAQELNQQTHNITRMNLVMRDINFSNCNSETTIPRSGLMTFFDENDLENTLRPLYVDAVVFQPPPYSANWDPENKELDPFWLTMVCPKSTADYAFPLHGLLTLTLRAL